MLALLGLGAAPLLAADGLDDPGGYATYAFDLNGAATDVATACAAQGDGKVVLVGTASTDDDGGQKIAITRLLRDGNPDPEFNNGSVVITLAGQVSANNGRARAVAIDKQGRILVGGTIHETVFFNQDIGFVVRLLTDGSIDPTWNNGWFPGWAFDGGTIGVMAMGFDAAGRLWTTGSAGPNETGPWHFQLMDDGGGDAGFGSFDFSPWATGFATSPTAIAFQPDGNVLIGGNLAHGPGSSLSSIAVARILGSTLALDPAFGPNGNGRELIDVASRSYLRSIGIQPDRRIVLAGESGPTSHEQVLVVGLDPDGTFHDAWAQDVAFTINGITTGGIGGMDRMVVQSDGKVVVAALSYTGTLSNVTDVGVARLTADGAIDTTFGGLGTGKRVFDMPPVGSGQANDNLTCLTLSGGKAVLAGGAQYSGSDWDFSMVRLTSDLVFTDSFESGSTFFWSGRL